jgi:hypothetical protein
VGPSRDFSATTTTTTRFDCLGVRRRRGAEIKIGANRDQEEFVLSENISSEEWQVVIRAEDFD